MLPKVSVIVPIYNAEAYLEQCVDSIRNQTLKEIEIILVDDGSPDRCPAMCSRFAEIDNRIRVIHQKNQGVSAARNHGIESASGEWIAFCDPDDWMDKEELQTLYDMAMREQADVVLCEYYKVYLNRRLTQEKEKTDSKICIFDENCRNEIVLRLAGQNPGALPAWNAVWGRLYRTEFVRDIRFPIGIHPCEDTIYNLFVFRRGGKVVSIGEKCIIIVRV